MPVNLTENKALVRRYYDEVLTASTGIHIHRVRHGRLVEHWEELNMLGVLRQLGASADLDGLPTCQPLIQFPECYVLADLVLLAA